MPYQPTCVKILDGYMITTVIVFSFSGGIGGMVLKEWISSMTTLLFFTIAIREK